MALTPEQEVEREKAFQAFLENRARLERMDAERRQREGLVELHLDLSAEDPAVNDRTFLDELERFSTSLHATGMPASQSGRALDAADATSFPLAQYTVQVVNAAIPAVAALCGAWVSARYGRKVRLKIGDREAEGRTTQEIEELFRIAERFQASFRDDNKGDARL